jgi:dipeptidyl-peptidase-4
MEYPELAGRTRRFTLGAPRAVSVSGDGERVVFLRSTGPEDPVDALWVLDVATGAERPVAEPARLLDAARADLPAAEAALRERLRLTASGIGSYALDLTGRVAVFTLAGRVFRADLTGEGDGPAVVEVPVAGPAVDPRPDPAGRRLAYVTGGALHLVDEHGTDSVLAGEDGVTWGLADFIAAEEFGRYRGYWWAPDGRSVLAARVDERRVNRWYLHDPAQPDQPAREIAYPFAGSTNAQLGLHLLDLDGGWVDVHWDKETYPYLVSVSWERTGSPLLTLMRRSQQHGLVLAVDPRTGETQVHAELSDPRWVEPIPGTPGLLPDGRALVGGEIAHDGYDARCLFADGSLITPTDLYVRRVAGRLDVPGSGTHLVLEATAGEPAEQHLYRVPIRSGASQSEVTALTTEPGWHTAACGGATLAVGRASLDAAGTTWSVWRAGTHVADLASHAAAPPYAPRPLLERVTDRGVPAAVLYPRDHVAGRRLPVLVDVYGGPHHQEVLAARSRWLEKQWWADQGFAVVTVDNRGTPGISPAFEKAIHRRMADVVLADQVDALRALAAKQPDLDLGRVAVRGWSFGGWLAGLAVLRRPDVFHAGIAGAPVTDWRLYDTAYTERYLGMPQDGEDIYDHHDLVVAASEPTAGPEPARPLLLVHGLVDDNVVAAHTLRLSAALLRTGRPHAVIPLTGATHMAAGGLTERLLRLELDFLRGALGRA